MADILENLADLHKQATEERSHYYVGSCIREAAAEIGRLRAAIAIKDKALTTANEAICFMSHNIGQPNDNLARKLGAKARDAIAQALSHTGKTDG